MKNSTNIKAAAEAYIARKSRAEHPDGTFDSARRWEPSDEERCDCCAYVRWPSRAWPLSLMKHCRSIEHVANLFKVDVTELRRAVRKIEKEAKERAAKAISAAADNTTSPINEGV